MSLNIAAYHWTAKKTSNKNHKSKHKFINSRRKIPILVGIQKLTKNCICRSYKIFFDLTMLFIT